MPAVQHLLETRFAVRLGRDLDAGWLRQRLDLLRRLTLPSVAAQATDAFTWVVLCDRSTDPTVLEELRAEERRLEPMRIELTGAERSPLAAMREVARDDADVLITTRLDSDDAIADAYLEAVREYARSFAGSGHEDLLVNFPRGYRYDLPHDRLYGDWMSHSSFHSLFERPRRGPVKTVMSAGHDNLRRRYAGNRRLTVLNEGGAGWHARLHQHYPTHQDESIVAWLIGVHGDNVVNRIPPTAPELPPGARPTGFTLGPAGSRPATPR